MNEQVIAINAQKIDLLTPEKSGCYISFSNGGLSVKESMDQILGLCCPTLIIINGPQPSGGGLVEKDFSC